MVSLDLGISPSPEAAAILSRAVRPTSRPALHMRGIFATLGMAGWRIYLITLDTAMLGMTGWRGEPARSRALSIAPRANEVRKPRRCPPLTQRRGQECVRSLGNRQRLRDRSPIRGNVDRHLIRRGD